MSDSIQRLSLDALVPQTQGTIISIDCQGPVRRRLMDMGLTPGTRVFVEGTAPFGDPIIVWARGCRLALRRLEAAQISIEPGPKSFAQPAGAEAIPRPLRGGHRHRWGRRGRERRQSRWRGNRGGS